MKIESANSARAIPPNCAPRNAPALLLLLTRPSCAQHARSLSWHTVIVMVLNRLSAAVLRYPGANMLRITNQEPTVAAEEEATVSTVEETVCTRRTRNDLHLMLRLTSALVDVSRFCP